MLARLLSKSPQRILAATALLCAVGCSSSGGHDGGVTHADAGPVGATCTADTDCSEGTDSSCLTATSGFPGGYCTSTCTADGGCPTGNPCVAGLLVDTQGKPLSVCLSSCASSSDCRSNYNCLNAGSDSFCWPFCKTDTDCLQAGETCDASTGLCSAPVPDAGPTEAADAGGSFTAVPLTGCATVGYSAQVTIGGSQTFTMSIDTGSTTTAVAASSCSDCGVSPEYTPGATAADTGQPNSSHYGSGSWNGEIFQDTIQVIPEMPAVELYFGAITSQAGFFLGSNCDGSAGNPSQGILGMGPLDLDTIGMISSDAYFNELVQASSIQNEFAVQLCALNGTMWLGGFDASKMVTPPQYTPMVPLNASSQPFYAVTLSDVALGGVSLGATDYGPSVVDTGTYGFLMPADAFMTLSTNLMASAAVTQVFGANMITANFFNEGNCVNAAGSMNRTQVDAALPPLSMTFPTAEGGSFTLTMPATSSYLIPITSGNSTCYVAGVASSGREGQTIIGASVQSSHITVFDPANNRIGFAPGIGCTGARL